MKEFLPTSVLVITKLILKKIQKTKMVILLFLIILGQGLYVSLPGLLGVLIDKVFVQSFWSIQWLMLFPAIWLTSILFSSFGKFYISSVTQDVRKISKELIFKHIIHLPNSVYVGRDAGEVEHLMHELSFNLRYLFNENVPFFIRTVVTLLASILIMAYTSVDLIFVFLGWAVLYIPISYLSAKKSVKFVAESLLSSAEVSASTVEVIENHELIPGFGTEVFECERFNKLLQREKDCYNKAQKKIDKTEFFQRLLQISLPISITLYLVFSGSLSGMTSGSIACIFSFTLILTNQIGDFGRGVLATMEMEERMKAALHKLSCPSKLQNSALQKENIKPTHWDILFKDVNFTYENTQTGIQNLNLEIKENEKIGIIGYSGAGKTTLIKLLRGLHKPDSGNIFIGGNELNRIDRKCLTQNIAEVSQSISLFHRSIRENVAYGCAAATDEEIWEALSKAHIADYVKKLPEGLDTIVGVRGQKLSGGEKARIGIARALIRKAKIIIFDEATASVDSKAEMLMQMGLEEVMKGRTSIAIAHRLSTLRKMKKIIVMDKGQMVAVGSHEELINQNELYNRLRTSQILT